MQTSLSETLALSSEDEASIQQLFDRQKGRSEVLRREDAEARAGRLRSLGKWIEQNRNAIQQALYADFRKPAEETDLTEIWTSQVEIRHTLKHLRKWMRPRKVGRPLSMVGTRSWVQYEPKGVCLIIAPWNYPFYLAIDPLASALAAGNCCVVKPSEHTPHVAALLRRMAEELFDRSAPMRKAALSLPTARR